MTYTIEEIINMTLVATPAIAVVMLLMTRSLRHPPYHKISDDNKHVSVYLYCHPQHYGYYEEYKFIRDVDDHSKFVPYITDDERASTRSFNISFIFFYSFLAILVAVVLALKASAVIGLLGAGFSLLVVVAVEMLMFLGDKRRWYKAGRYLKKHIDEINIR